MKHDRREIPISNDSRIMDIIVAFSAPYPFLKIEFLLPDKRVVTMNNKIDPGAFLKQLVTMNVPHLIDISLGRTVAEVAHDFQKATGLLVHICRKSGNVWNLISVTTGWTLERQNEAGKFICSEMSLPSINPND